MTTLRACDNCAIVEGNGRCCPNPRFLPVQEVLNRLKIAQRLCYGCDMKWPLSHDGYHYNRDGPTTVGTWCLRR